MNYRLYEESGPQGHPDYRNPHDNPFREFVYDVCHPVKLFQRVRIGAWLGLYWLFHR